MNRDFAYPGLRTIERETGMSHATVLKYLNLLVSEGWVGKQSGDRDTTNRYWITFPEGVGQEVTYVSSGEKVGREVTHNNKGITNTLSKGKRFARPTLDEVKIYCAEKGYTVDPERFINHYESNGWKVGKNSMKSWQAALANWNKTEKQSVNRNKTNSTKSTSLHDDLTDTSWAN